MPTQKIVTMAPHSRSTIYLNGEFGNIGGVASTFNSDTLPFLAERSIYWGAGRVEGTNVIGASAAAAEWHFPEGSSGGQFDTYLLLANPGSNDATVRLTLFIEGVGRFTASQPELLRTVRAGPRVTIYMNDFLTRSRPPRAVPSAASAASRSVPGRRPEAATQWSRKRRSTGSGTVSTSGARAPPRSAFPVAHPAAAPARCRRHRRLRLPAFPRFPTVLSPAADRRPVRRCLARPFICRSK